MKWLQEQAQLNPDHLFLDDYSYKEIYERVIQTAYQLNTKVSKYPRIALLSENSINMVVVLFALWVLDKEVLLLNTHLTEREINEQLIELDVELVIKSDQHSFSSSGQIFCFSEIENLPIKTVQYLNWDPKPEQILALMNTSATTGKFKSVPITWKMICHHVEASASVLGVTSDDNWLIILPIFHVSGLSIIMRTLYNGTQATILDHFDPEQVLRFINETSVNMISLVPTLLKGIYNKITPHALRLILLGGEYIPHVLIQNCLELKLPIYKTYGMTETFSQSVTFNILDHPDKLNAVGKALDGVQISISNPDSDGIGEIQLDSPMLIDSYLNQSMTHPFTTGDIGYIDDDNFLYILNRRKDIIISGGENIYPKEIEDLVYTLDGVNDCALVPKADEKWGQVPVLFYSGTATVQDILDFLTARIAKYKLPQSIIPLEHLPKTATGKILRKDLKIED
ncbi:MAG: o-succinylbenzoate--CoA ligase [Streptococcaceae bacterium]|nr:o-succinylbenzoate--CoA ligase [Streptococcaceae bacterium]MCL2681035.1 o-succinylbenzoate--CoA ligase [Streptococcaceae bacterium]MCL2858333.1 o-succinylbenzoate--CoA ligase [Streptococcaceae bacterium]